jgi:hypothetical protein
VFSPQSSINLCAYTLLATHSVAYDQLIPVFMHHPVQAIQDPAVQLPFKFAGGFGINAARIGALSTIYGLFGMILQFTVFPPLAHRIGVLTCFRIAALGFPLVYLATPFTSLFPTTESRQAVMLALMLAKGLFCVFAFPCSTILLTNSASSLEILGTLNGVSVSISAIGRAAGPALCGLAFTFGVSKGYIITPWWLLTGLSVLAALPVFWLRELGGFAGHDNQQQQKQQGKDDTDDEEGESPEEAQVMTPDLLPSSATSVTAHDDDLGDHLAAGEEPRRRLTE